MNFGRIDLLRVNRGFGGNLRSDSSLDFAMNKIEDKRIGPYKKLAYLFREILVDHPFSDGNKRTAMFLAFSFSERNKKQVDRELLAHHIMSIAKQNVSDIRKIERRLKNAIK